MSLSDLYINTTTGGELDLRDWMDQILFGTINGIKHGHPIILRKFRRANNKRVSCTCLDEAGSPSPTCPYCDGEGFLWDESWVWSYTHLASSEGGKPNITQRQPYGTIRIDTRVFYFRYDTAIHPLDKLVMVQMDSDGTPVAPYVRTSIYKIGTIEEHRSDNGRIEFISVYCAEDDALRLERE